MLKFLEGKYLRNILKNLNILSKLADLNRLKVI